MPPAVRQACEKVHHLVLSGREEIHPMLKQCSQSFVLPIGVLPHFFPSPDQATKQFLPYLGATIPAHPSSILISGVKNQQIKKIL